MTEFLLALLWIIPVIMMMSVALYFMTRFIMNMTTYLLKTTDHQRIKRLTAFIIMPVSILLFVYASTFLTEAISHSGWSILLIGFIAISLLIIQLIAGSYLVGSYLQKK